ncbi:hypothetical protein F2Q70_00032372 [Brassica cretica]|uniref:Uncharacterized protein n=1 Tax=Brassica cretica TaxID=69181 RepID=A0A3N6QMU0_BRACR|nr:hypothetical protein F2Q70_00032372 [Brassica cretica]KAF3498962.1 hypothetical protein DY000_02053967 [Brassica cretica]
MKLSPASGLHRTTGGVTYVCGTQPGKWDRLPPIWDGGVLLRAQRPGEQPLFRPDPNPEESEEIEGSGELRSSGEKIY